MKRIILAAAVLAALSLSGCAAAGNAFGCWQNRINHTNDLACH